ncbi:MAG: hypothetical protein ACTHLU_03160 [Novosphingobium sp.]
MSEPKPLASLSPTLLARKGTAKPAMRPQVHYPDALARTVIEDDLGWNDMGEESAAAPLGAALPATVGPDRIVPGEVVPIKAKVELPLEPLKPAVVEQQEQIARSVAPPQCEPEPAPPKAAKVPAPAVQAPVRRSALDRGARAAFTLRMDAERHLKLRLACTIRNRSAQQLVTEALDRLIDELPDLATLAAQVAERR